MIQHEILEIFSSRWWSGNLPTVFGIVLILLIGKQVSPKRKDRLAIILGVMLIAREALIHPYRMHLGLWTLRDSLPLHMCGISAVLSGVVLIWRHQLVYEFVYLIGIPGAFHSLLTPEFTHGTEGLLFPDYFLSHGGIILSALYLTLVLDMRPNKGAWWKLAIKVQPLVLLVGFINRMLDANYMYLCQKPIVSNPFVIGDWPWYILGLEIAGLLHVLLLYLPFGVYYHKQALVRA